eukprot:TRINITY_DN77_c1_g4_i1.p1 TRINITY_DN77_c1_g4~~TRINITY_DN77_c1_g4_i1.p1  ORF type:complete len:559 (-),score=124.96 TRINITY_DN77_c1_g4_i1:1213-2889(-)
MGQRGSKAKARAGSACLDGPPQGVASSRRGSSPASLLLCAATANAASQQASASRAHVASACAVAFLCGEHPRCGGGSQVRCLPFELLRRITCLSGAHRNSLYPVLCVGTGKEVFVFRSSEEGPLATPLAVRTVVVRSACLAGSGGCVLYCAGEQRFDTASQLPESPVCRVSPLTGYPAPLRCPAQCPPPVLDRRASRAPQKDPAAAASAANAASQVPADASEISGNSEAIWALALDAELQVLFTLTLNFLMCFDARSGVCLGKAVLHILPPGETRHLAGACVGPGFSQQPKSPQPRGASASPPPRRGNKHRQIYAVLQQTKDQGTQLQHPRSVVEVWEVRSRGLIKLEARSRKVVDLGACRICTEAATGEPMLLCCVGGIRYNIIQTESPTSINVWTLPALDAKAYKKGPGYWISHMATSPGSRYLMMGAVEGSVFMYDHELNQKWRCLLSHTSFTHNSYEPKVSAVCVSDDGAGVSAGADGVVKGYNHAGGAIWTVDCGPSFSTMCYVDPWPYRVTVSRALEAAAVVTTTKSEVKPEQQAVATATVAAPAPVQSATT